jgi:hypothetical protein
MMEMFIGQGYRTSNGQWIDHWEIFRRSLISIALRRPSKTGVGLRDRSDWLQTLLITFPLHMRAQKMFSPDFY